MSLRSDCLIPRLCRSVSLPMFIYVPSFLINYLAYYLFINFPLFFCTSLSLFLFLILFLFSLLLSILFYCYITIRLSLFLHICFTFRIVYYIALLPSVSLLLPFSLCSLSYTSLCIFIFSTQPSGSSCISLTLATAGGSLGFDVDPSMSALVILVKCSRIQYHKKCSFHLCLYSNLSDHIFLYLFLFLLIL